MGIVNRRNAVLGWAVWKLGKRTAKRKAKGVAPTIEGGRPNRPLVAAGGLAGALGALAFWRKKKTAEKT